MGNSSYCRNNARSVHRGRGHVLPKALGKVKALGEIAIGVPSNSFTLYSISISLIEGCQRKKSLAKNTTLKNVLDFE